MLYYFLLKDRPRQLYISKDTTKVMKWHRTGRSSEEGATKFLLMVKCEKTLIGDSLLLPQMDAILDLAWQ